MGSGRAFASPYRKSKEAARRPPLGMGSQQSEQLIITPFAGYRCDRPEQSIHLAVGTSGKIESVGVRVSAASQGYRPQTVNRQRLVRSGIPQEAVKVSVRLERGDFAIAEIADEDVTAEPAKRERRPRDAPW